MKNRTKNIALTYGVNLLFVALLIAMASTLSALGPGGPFSAVFFFVVIFSLLPVANHLHTIIDSFISPIRYNDLYVQTVDSILSIGSFDEVLRATFDQILDLISVETGMLIFYYHDRDEFNIFYQKNRRRKIIRNARIAKDNILFRVIGGSEDVIVRSKLNPSIHFENSIIAELDRLGGEVAVPIYYHRMFLGIIVTGWRRRRLSPGEIRLLKIFASKIAILSVNSFFFGEIVRKKELEKEYELAAKVQKKFLPSAGGVMGRFEIRVHHETASLMIREFYDLFENDSVEDEIRVSAYRIRDNIAGTSILMPGVQSVLQSF
ncbi:MAG TPA: GAF domain-containing protein, partial [Spirochaetota bacterium]|nr:GAF domain-containing protein [Spirochaetota bacterium]